MMLLRHHAALHLFNDQAEAITVLKVCVLNLSFVCVSFV